MVSQTCWQLEADGHRYTVALPPGFELTGDVLTDTAGQTYSPGDEIDAIATEISVGDVDFPGGADGRWALYHAGCDPDGWPVLLVGDVAHAFDPRALTAPELRELVEDAELSQAVHGGSGFYHHSPDGRVAVSVEPRPGIVENPADGDTVVVATVVFPDDAWTAEVLVGKNFGAGAGNDTPPGWYADWVTAARLDLVDGRLEDLIVQAVPDSCDRMTATLVGAVAVTATGDRVDLPRINLFNGARNCF